MNGRKEESRKKIEYIVNHQILVFTLIPSDSFHSNSFIDLIECGKKEIEIEPYDIRKKDTLCCENGRFYETNSS